MKELTIDATIENIAAVTAFIDEQLEQRDCPMKTKRQIHAASRISSLRIPSI